jgi:hypothetical protein
LKFIRSSSKRPPGRSNPILYSALRRKEGDATNWPRRKEIGHGKHGKHRPA